MFDYGVCFGGMLRGYASGYASRSVKTKVVAFSEGMLRGMLFLSRTSQPYINWTPQKKKKHITYGALCTCGAYILYPKVGHLHQWSDWAGWKGRDMYRAPLTTSSQVRHSQSQPQVFALAIPGSHSYCQSGAPVRVRYPRAWERHLCVRPT